MDAMEAQARQAWRSLPAGVRQACGERPRGRRTPEPGSEGWQYRYADVCANCGGAIAGEFTGVLADGEVISWRHRDGFAFGCGGRVDRLAPQAIPADEADAVCTVHGRVSRWHLCETAGIVRLADGAGAARS